MILSTRVMAARSVGAVEIGPTTRRTPMTRDVQAQIYAILAEARVVLPGSTLRGTRLALEAWESRPAVKSRAREARAWAKLLCRALELPILKDPDPDRVRALTVEATRLIEERGLPLPE
jgi:hypothetical protein